MYGLETRKVDEFSNIDKIIATYITQITNMSSHVPLSVMILPSMYPIFDPTHKLGITVTALNGLSMLSSLVIGQIGQLGELHLGLARAQLAD